MISLRTFKKVLVDSKGWGNRSLAALALLLRVGMLRKGEVDAKIRERCTKFPVNYITLFHNSIPFSKFGRDQEATTREELSGWAVRTRADLACWMDANANILAGRVTGCFERAVGMSGKSKRGAELIADRSRLCRRHSQLRDQADSDQR